MASSLAAKTGGYIYTEHLLYGLLALDDCSAKRILNSCGVRADDVISSFTPSPYGGKPQMSQRASDAVERAIAIANRFGSAEVGTEHVLFCLLEDSSSGASRLLYSLGVNPAYIRQVTVNCIVEEGGRSTPCPVGGGERTENVISGYNNALPKESLKDMVKGISYPQNPQKKPEQVEKTDLSNFGTDLTQKAKSGRLDPVIGRDKETERVIEILSRRTKNNPILIGEPGVGKSAVVDGLALRIANGEVPEELKNKTVFSLDLTSLVAGTRYRGDFEERLKNTLDAIKQRGDVILFIDEIHTILKAGSSEGGLDIANIIKPMLARGELTTIGATTLEEYTKQFAKDSALERRFQPVRVDEPSVGATCRILYGLKEKYEKHHGVVISDEAIKAAATLSDRYVTDRFLPDKAVDLIDEAAAKQRLRGGSMVSANDIADVVSSWTGIPVSKISSGEGERLSSLESILHSRVIGQNEAVSAVARAIKRARAGLNDLKRPLGSFIFLGPTGVGKTELAKALAEALFYDEDMLIRVDMSEYMEKEAVSRLIGSAPGLVGYEEGGQLTEKVRRKPYSVVLFDEIEKGHPDIFNLLLQILEDGVLTDSQGRKVSFKNTVVILTSNIGAKEASENRATLGFGSAKSVVGAKDKHIAALKAYMKPEILNRIDEIIVFDPLSEQDLEKIADIMLTSLGKRLNDKGISFKVTPSAKALLIRSGYEPEYGARPLRRTIRRMIEDRLSEKIISGQLTSGSTVILNEQNGEIVFDIVK